MKRLRPNPPKAEDVGKDLAANRILRAVPQEELKRLLPHLKRVTFRANDIVFGNGEPTRYIFLPE